MTAQENHNNDNNPNIVKGPEIERMVDISLGEFLFNILPVHDTNLLYVDVSTREQLPADVLLAKAIHLAKWFKSQGFGLNTNISVMAENRLEYSIVTAAAFFEGITFAPFNFEYQGAELSHVLNLSKPKVVFTSENTLDRLLKVLPNHPHIQKVILFGKNKRKDSRILAWSDLVPDIVERDETYEPKSIDLEETVATILCSSGTTGLPKGVMCTHANMAAFIDIARTRLSHMTDGDDEDGLMGLTPFFHSFGFMLMFLNMVRGKKMVVMSQFHVKTFLDAIVEHKIARLILPPPVLLILLKHPLVKNYDLSCLKEIRSGAAALGKDMEKELKQRFKTHRLSQAYGMTETTLGILMSDGQNAKLGSVGTIVPGMMAKIIDENGEALGPYQEGELCLKGSLIMKGYVGDNASTADVIDKDRWLHTGDIAYYDDDKDFFIVDRIKELIKYKGFQVAPAELENLLLTHPAVQDVGVTGFPDEIAEELPMAFIVKREGKDVTEKELIKFVAENVSQTKQLRGGVIFVDHIPKNPTGKILRRILKQRARDMKKVKSKL